VCGIIGIHRLSGLTDADRADAEAGLGNMFSRGPDGDGRYERDGLYFGHRRLAVQDVDNGQQPWTDSESGVTLVYNGELYNTVSLREDLQARGHRFVSRCDTEVLIKAYLEWGESCLHHLDGIFAFGIDDPRRNVVWLVRDRLGIKPLYFAAGSGRLAFASSLAGLFAFRFVERRIDPVVLAHYFLTIRTSLGPRTLVEGIETVEPGQHITWNKANGSVARQTYWHIRPRTASEKWTGTFGEACESVRERLMRAVDGQLISDVPLGGFLSGGIDSSVLAASILKSGHREAFHACSVGYRRDGYNEWEFVREATAFHGVACQEIELEERDFVPDWRTLIRRKGLPLSTPNEVAIWRLAEAFKRRFTVAMTGEGADEVFGGYAGPTWCAFDYDRWRAGEISTGALLRAYGKSRFTGRADHFLTTNSWIPFHRQRQLFPLLHATAQNQLAVAGYYDELFEPLSNCTTLDAYLHIHSRINLEGLLSRLDSSTMAASVEGRVPFTDHTLVEWVFQLPDAFKMCLSAESGKGVTADSTSFDLIQSGQVETKRLLRKGFRDMVPERIRNRPKSSFPVPFLEWFQGDVGSQWRDLLGESVLLSEITDEGWRNDVCSGHLAVDGMLAWPLMNLALMEEIWGLRL